MTTIIVTDTTTVTELNAAIAEVLAASRNVEALIDMAGDDVKRAKVYWLRWDRLADKLEVLVDEVRVRTRDSRPIRL